MVDPKTITQIKHYIGSNVKITLKDDGEVYGTLAFFNFDQQVIHISDYMQSSNERNIDGSKTGNKVENAGQFIIINFDQWKSLEVIYK